MTLSITDQILSHCPDILDQGMLSQLSQSDIPTQHFECGISDAKHQGQQKIHFGIRSGVPSRNGFVQVSHYLSYYLIIYFPFLPPILHVFFLCFLVILRHVLSSLFFVGQPKVFSVTWNLQPNILQHYGELPEIIRAFMWMVGSMELSNKAFPRGDVCVLYLHEIHMK